ncbi:MAG: nuclease-related domain-containing protein [Verrucomicrobiia bacterium]
MHVVESKSFRTKVRHANGGWERLNYSHWEGIPSPVEQNERHILVLGELIDQLQLAPTRLGMALVPTFLNCVIVHPACSIIGNVPNDVRIHRMDELVAVIRKETPSALKLFKVVAPETLMSFANHLVACHKPASRPEPLKTSSELANRSAPIDRSPAGLCQGCGGKVTSAKANFCLVRKARFAGQVLCRSCQKLVPHQVPGTRPPGSVQNSKPAGHCAECENPVDSKVLFFCRVNADEFGKRVLCRKCQEVVRQRRRASSEMTPSTGKSPAVYSSRRR